MGRRKVFPIQKDAQEQQTLLKKNSDDVLVTKTSSVASTELSSSTFKPNDLESGLSKKRQTDKAINDTQYDQDRTKNVKPISGIRSNAKKKNI
jgi:hypothetical protein